MAVKRFRMSLLGNTSTLKPSSLRFLLRDYPVPYVWVTSLAMCCRFESGIALGQLAQVGRAIESYAVFRPDIFKKNK